MDGKNSPQGSRRRKLEVLGEDAVARVGASVCGRNSGLRVISKTRVPNGGAVAQLGARLDGIEEVVGSNPIGSTRSSGRFLTLDSPLIHHIRCGLAFLSLASASILLSPPRKGNSGEDLSEFYVVWQGVSDASPHWWTYILDARAEGEGTRVRYIRIAPANSFCARDITVKTVERLLPRTRPRQLAQPLHICSLSEIYAQTAIRRSHIQTAVVVDEHPVSSVIVARCGSRESIFPLPYLQTLDFKELKKKAPDVAALWALADEIPERIFGREFPSEAHTTEQDSELQSLGAKVAPEIFSGKYDRGAGDVPCEWIGRGCDPKSLASVLRDYHDLLADSVPARVQLLNSQELKLSIYVPPRYPRIAQQARIYGTVELELEVDAQTGWIKDGRAISGHPLLQGAAMEVARYWRLDPKETLQHSVRAVLGFSIQCFNE